MPTPIKTLLLFVMINFSSIAVAQDWVWAPDFPEGNNIPPIAAPDQNGDLRTLADLSGRNGLVLVLSRSFDWCPYCISQLQQLVDVAPEFEAMGINVATMTYDSLQTLKNAETDYDVDFPMLSDEDTRHFSALNIVNNQYEPGDRAYGIPYPGIFLIDADGVIRFKFAEEDYRERPDFSQVLAAARYL
ncbi:peroxiredoxin family protein [Pseudohongiella sp.]|uniref:Thioredoxin domain-containing protein n=1 Tax=marine sediment metagenome TaxID=412755 RepID=A0A0F9Y3C2_9ZZZZ|nr:peroxiredoxin family protein [Pseudohongiella sp.]HDZ08833.1 peroxiredoxin family protein [Pseudohongiella sp.]HEA62810.1 peroxiredoxin family protein [Pseudohongiella sp.]